MKLGTRCFISIYTYSVHVLTTYLFIALDITTNEEEFYVEDCTACINALSTKG
jgi:hypothetical protein